MEKSIAIIPARGGSKRIPKKNIKDFCGKPIIAYSIGAALESGVFEEVMVSTDSEEIAEIAKKYGARVPFFRSSQMADDYATTAQVVMEVLEEYKKLGREFDYVFCLYPTAPFTTPELIRDAVKIMDTYKPDEVIAVVEFSYPPQRCYSMDENGFISYKYKEYIDTRSQDLEKLYHDAGQFYIYNVKPFYMRNGRIEDGIMPIILSPMSVQDIDTEEDWLIAEAKYKLWVEKEGKKDGQRDS
ncbi:MAG TPA: pseudaminic acid cytidylyltransferase [Acetivibrio sp.]|uniref:pseudaminic acid cytidylyltransferase n=1 Tax=Acetivibrio sp. TaxID=1872092 RepID=UPI002C7FD7DE|nr:pseudaminic acid cytidylyltransferase [Acetivibrio sp.]HOM01300.1 pseudaminic acid cytidylyltransferase [Acetivibrio sp.]